MRKTRSTVFVALACIAYSALAEPAVGVVDRIVELTAESKATYNNPFMDVDVDVVFTKDGSSWRVPAFWRGENQWSVRFAPRQPGEYSYHFESTDATNPDLNGRPGKVA